MSAPAARTNRPAPAGHAGSAKGTRQRLDELDALLQRMLDLPVNPDAAAEEVEEEARDPIPARPARATAEPPPPERRGYPPSYMVVETSTPPFPEAPEGQYEDPLAPRQVEEPRDALFETPGPGGRPEFGADLPTDPIGDLARLRARLESKEEEWVPLRSSWQPSEQTWKPLAETWQQSRALPAAPPAQQPAWTGAPQPWLPEREDRPPWSEEPVVPLAPPHAVTPREAPERPAALLPLVWFNKTFDLFLFPLGPAGGWLKRPSGRGFLGTIGLLCLLGAAALAAATRAGIEGLGWPR
jgi:hypothetical protein